MSSFISCLFKCWSRNWNPENTPYFDLKGTFVWVKCLSVYDGDTYTVAFHHDGKRYRWKCRCAGWDAPEMRTKNANEKEAAQKAKERMVEWWQSRKWVARLEIQGWDKYGRLLTHNDELKKWMFDSNLVRAYDGGHKDEWTEINLS